MPLADPILIEDSDRLTRLHGLNLLDTSPEPAFDRLTRLASKVLNAPISLLSLVDAHRQFFKSEVGLEPPPLLKRETPLRESFCQHVVGTRQPLIVEDTRKHPLLSDIVADTNSDVLAYAGIPLTTSDGFTLGSFCVADRQPRKWTADEVEILAELAQSVMTEIELRTELQERKKAEAAFRENEHFVKRILQAIPDVVYILDLKAKKSVYFNHDIMTRLGYTPEERERIRNSGNGISLLIHPEDMAAFTQYITRLSSGSDTDVAEVEIRLKNAYDDWVWIRNRGIVFKRAADGTIEQVLTLGSDVTRQKRMDKQYREHQQLLMGIMETTPDSIYVFDLFENRSVFANREVHQVLGYTAAQVAQMGNFLQAVTHPDDAPASRNHFAALGQSPDGVVLEHEYRLRDVNGNWRWFSGHDAVFKRTPDGTVQQIAGIAREITQHKQMVEALRENEARLRAIVTNVPLILFTTDKDGVLTLSVGKALDAVGRKQNESVGRNIFDLYPNQEEITQRVRRAMAGETVTGLLEVGDIVYDAWYSPLYDADGSVNGIIGVATNITERVRAEQTLQETLERLLMLRQIETELSRSLDLESVLLIAMETMIRVTEATDAFIGLFNGDQVEVVHAIGGFQHRQLFDRGVGIIGRVLHSLQPELITDVHQDPEYVAYLPGTHAKMCVPLVYRERLIGIINLETSISETFTSDAFEFVKLLSGQVTLAIDNAQLYEVAQGQLNDLAGLYARVSELEQLKTDIIRIAAHDLRNPLSQVLGFSELMLEEPAKLDDEQKEFVEIIHRAGKKMDRLITDIMSLQRIEAVHGGDQEAVDLTEMVNALFEENRQKAESKTQDYQLSIPETAVKVQGDAAQFREAVDNLIGNAIKYTPANGSVAVRLWVSDADQKAVFEVQDSGVGIPEEQQARLFQPFFRAKTNETARIEGTGLGLHLVKNIIERHHGTMRFESVYRRGSTFGFELPLA